MSVDKKILEEISKYNNINKYITEQETDLPEPIEGGELDLESPELEVLYNLSMLSLTQMLKL